MKALISFALLGLALPAMANRLPLPGDTPASYRAECGGCHLAYPPALLSAQDWQRTLGSLAQHFGSDAAVDTPKRQEISAFLQRHAGKLGSAGEPPRISQTPRFVRHHREVPTKYWRDPRVKSAANCEACHRGAADGRYSEHNIALPELRR